MMTGNGSNRAWCGDTKGHCSTFIASLLCESAEQKVGKSRKHKGLRYSSLLKRFK